MDDFTPPPDFGLPVTPSRPEIAAALREIREALESAQIPYTVESTENPDTWCLIADDAQGYTNLAFIGWSDTTSTVIYQAYDPVRELRDIKEGIPEDDSACWWTPRTVDQVVAFLTGEVRKIVEKARAIALAEIERWTAESR